MISAETIDNNRQSGLRVLMISADPGLVSDTPGSGDSVQRHQRYAARVVSLDIIVLGGESAISKNLSKNCTVHATGPGKATSLIKARSLATSIIRRHGVNLIVAQDPHATGLVGLWAKRKCNIPLIVHFHGDFWDNPHWRQESVWHGAKNILQKQIVPAADGIRVVSHGIQKTLVAAGIPEEKIAVIHTPVNSERFTTILEENRIKLEKLRFKYAERRIVLFVGRLVAAKNIPLLLDVMVRVHKQIPNALLILIGEGPEQERINTIISDQHLESYVHVLGGKSHDELVVWYRLAEVLVLLSSNESFGKVIIEAGLCGTPTLASETTGARDIIQDGITGFLVPINDPVASSEVLIEMLDFKEGTQALGAAAALRYTQHYSLQQTVDAIIQFWYRVARL